MEAMVKRAEHPGLSLSDSGSFPSFGYDIPPTPNVTPEESSSTCNDGNLNKLVVLTRATRFLQTHILSVLLSQEYTVRGMITVADTAAEVDALFAVHKHARKYLFIQQISPMVQRDWERALESANYVIHVVAPLTQRRTFHSGDDDSSKAVDVTLKIMAACVKTKSVQRIILITSVASIAWSRQTALRGGVFNEDDWEDEHHLTGYSRCQLDCEKAAWNFIHTLPDEDKIEFVVLNPAVILGPLIQGKSTQTIGVVRGLMQSSLKGLPTSTLPIVDVRDVAQAAAVSLVKASAVGHRHILYGATIWVEEMADILDREFSRQGYKVLTKRKVEAERKAALCSCFPHHPKIKKDLNILATDATIIYSNKRMISVLGIEPHNPEETIIETAYSLIHYEQVRKARKEPRKS